MLDVALLLISLGVILLGAEGFTNGIEWLGKKLKLTEGAVGSILAAVGTALPETMIPIIAILFGGGGHAGEEIGIGAILGAPFMLSTLAFFITGIAVIAYRSRRPNFPKMNLDTRTMGRDLSFFLCVYAVAVLASFLGAHIWKQIIAIGLVIAYATYAYLTVTNGHTLEEGEELNPLYLARKAAEPATLVILAQVILALGMIVGGARLFVNGVEDLARIMGIPPFVLALIIAPIATELPEKFNSIIWVGRGKDTLALGNITGAMVFQSSVIPALGITMTSWELTQGALISAILAIVSAGLVFLQISRKKYLTPYTLVGGGAFYGIFVLLVFGGFIR
ncbi:sodium:calcium antiporter [Neomoorella mulderi]|uniref:Putative calcium/sodium:proton antiporter n=1 Tax=Moorella mulderi DSM 14980 TaxID=1122241 RepID=A0A151AYA9_9FIRM|nr:sodium:calcium antiporter [Moorella mulderi]KYH32621.1 putative calcium/sodium:proton antiporter [Moorella mulderi DSM 14980]